MEAAESPVLQYDLLSFSLLFSVNKQQFVKQACDIDGVARTWY
jgi:hypothetical protein